MTRKRKIIIGIVLLVVIGGIAYANIGFKRNTATTVNVEKIQRRDLESIVTASGKVQPKRSVNISAETMGKVVDLRVNEGEMVTKGQLLLQIDPRNLETNVQNREASLAVARSVLDQSRTQIENSRVALRQAEDNLRRAESMLKSGLIPREQYERALNDFKMKQTDLRSQEQSVTTQEQRIRQEQASLSSARYDLTKVRVISPIAGLVTRRNIEEGETALLGTMNNPGTVLLTIADMSVIETELEVDETDIPFVAIGQPAKVTIDAIPGRIFTGKVTEVGNSPIQATGSGASATAGRATNFKVVVTIDGTVPGVRPGFTCTAAVTTATRPKALAVPIQAMTVRELLVNQEGEIVRPPEPAPGERRRPQPSTTEPAAGQSRKEIEGAFIIKDGKAVFVAVTTGIAGEKYFEVLTGLKEGDEVIIGPFASVRNLKDGDVVKVEAAAGSRSRQ